MTKEFLNKIIAIRNELIAPKKKYSNFGKYQYRSLDDITMPLKRLELKYGVFHFFDDDIIEIEGVRYFRSIAVITDGTERFEQKVMIREETQSRNGMSAGQTSAATTSFAHKYALGTLLFADESVALDLDEINDVENFDEFSEFEEKSEEQQKVQPKPTQSYAKKPGKPGQKPISTNKKAIRNNDNEIVDERISQQILKLYENQLGYDDANILEIIPGANLKALTKKDLDILKATYNRIAFEQKNEAE